MARSTVRIGTRGSALALAQTHQLIARLRSVHPGLKFVPVVIKTTGDRLTGVEQLRTAGKGVFVKELERALKVRKIDAAVHSLKDVPSELPEGLVLGAIPERAEAADAFVGRTVREIDKLRPGAVIGTASLRRQALIRAHWPALEVVDLRGNLDTRLRKLMDPRSKLSGIVVAAAGLHRLRDTGGVLHQLLPKHLMVPPAGQGALAVEIRGTDEEMRRLLAPIHHEPTALAVRAERELQRRLEGGCQVPLGAFATLGEDGLLSLHAALALPDGNELIEADATGVADTPEEVAEAAESILRARGATDLLAALQPRRSSRPSSNGRRALKSRARTRR